MSRTKKLSPATVRNIRRDRALRGEENYGIGGHARERYAPTPVTKVKLKFLERDIPDEPQP